MIRKDKDDFIVEFAKDFERMKACVFADFKGLSVKKFTGFRRKLYDEKVNVQVVKNKLAGKAIKSGNGKLSSLLKGPTCVIYSFNDEVKPAKVAFDFIKKEEKFKLKGGYLPGKFLSLAEIESLSALPSREVLLSKMLMCMKSPVSGFVNVLSGNTRSLIYCLRAIEAKKKETEIAVQEKPDTLLTTLPTG